MAIKNATKGLFGNKGTLTGIMMAGVMALSYAGCSKAADNPHEPKKYQTQPTYEATPQGDQVEHCGRAMHKEKYEVPVFVKVSGSFGGATGLPYEVIRFDIHKSGTNLDRQQKKILFPGPTTIEPGDWKCFKYEETPYISLEDFVKRISISGIDFHTIPLQKGGIGPMDGIYTK